jgi:hypothetical protein
VPRRARPLQALVRPHIRTVATDKALQPRAGQYLRAWAVTAAPWDHGLQRIGFRQPAERVARGGAVVIVLRSVGSL